MKIKNLFLSLTLSSAILFTGCYGSFSLVTKVHEWNGSVTDNKFVHELLFLGLNIIPVYGVSAFIDAVIFNTVEFWTGSNPIAMKEGDEEIKYIRAHGVMYTITKTPNQYHIKGDKGGEIVLSYEPAEMAWYLESEGCCNKLTQFEMKNKRKIVKQFFPDGSVKQVEI